MDVRRRRARLWRRFARTVSMVSAATIALVSTLVACGVPRDGEVTPLGADDLPGVLVSTTIATTTTTAAPDPVGPGAAATPATVYEPVEVDFDANNMFAEAAPLATVA